MVELAWKSRRKGRMSSYRNTVEKLNEQQDGKPVYFGPCQVCSKTTLKETLGNYGSRCFQCYEAYVVEQVPSGPFVDKEKYGDRAWAHSLKARERFGGLSGAQKTMWRAVLGDEK
jgi:hypothetical protein